MASKFGKNYPVIATKNDKDKILFFAAALLALSLVVIFIMIVNVKRTNATQELAPNTPSSAATNIGTVPLYAPERPVKAGTALSSIQFKQVYWPRNQVPEGAILQVAEMQKMFAKSDLMPGVPVQRIHLTAEQTVISLPLTPGNRAVSIEVDETSGVEGFAQPGTRVDVVLTSTEEGKPQSSIVVQNARIISVGGDMSTLSQRGSGRVSNVRRTTMTLDVSTEDALKISTARQLGRLSLLMRSDDDNDAAKTVNVGTDDLSKKKGQPAVKHETCNRGVMKMGGKQYMIGCRGELTLVEGDEP